MTEDKRLEEIRKGYSSINRTLLSDDYLLESGDFLLSVIDRLKGESHQHWQDHQDTLKEWDEDSDKYVVEIRELEAKLKTAEDWLEGLEFRLLDLKGGLISSKDLHPLVVNILQSIRDKGAERGE